MRVKNQEHFRAAPQASYTIFLHPFSRTASKVRHGSSMAVLSVHNNIYSIIERLDSNFNLVLFARMPSASASASLRVLTVF